MHISTLIFTGGKSGSDTPGFVGCMRLISIDGNFKLPSDWRPDEYCCPGEVLFDSCQMTDRFVYKSTIHL